MKIRYITDCSCCFRKYNPLLREIENEKKKNMKFLSLSIIPKNLTLYTFLSSYYLTKSNFVTWKGHKKCNYETNFFRLSTNHNLSDFVHFTALERKPLSLLWQRHNPL